MSGERSDETSQKYRDIRDLSHAFEMTQRRPLLIKRYTLHIKRFCHVERAQRRDISRKQRTMSCLSVAKHLKKQRKIRDFFGQSPQQHVSLRIRMTKQRFVIGEFISVTMNEPMLFCFVIDEFCSNRSNVALPPLRQ